LKRAAWTCLPITAEILAEAYSLPPPIHRDPADRVLISTSGE
jgi:PIN domain nuclease of toxin-antitoxin system